MEGLSLPGGETIKAEQNFSEVPGTFCGAGPAAENLSDIFTADF
ncbi:MAG: hypothetical protein ACOWWO_08410 [Peptococcaceae bacterium]